MRGSQLSYLIRDNLTNCYSFLDMEVVEIIHEMVWTLHVQFMEYWGLEIFEQIVISTQTTASQMDVNIKFGNKSEIMFRG